MSKNPAKNKTVHLESGVYEVIRLKMGDVRELLGSGDMDSMALAEKAILKDGSPIGDKFNDLYFDEATKLLTEVTKVNGLGGGEGND
jgi:hypothetical protein